MKKIAAVMLAVLCIIGSTMTVCAMPGGGQKGTLPIKTWGCDLSYWNDPKGTATDFKKMAADGCDFVILRFGYNYAQYGGHSMDPTFLPLYQRAHEAGIAVGAYFYGQETTYAGSKTDAEWTIKMIEENNLYLEYPIYYDIEEHSQISMGSAAMTQLALGWAETLAAKNYLPGVYGGQSQVINKLASSYTDNYEVWYAAVKTAGHGSQYDPRDYDPTNICGMWQYAWYDCTFDGVASDGMDADVAYKDYRAITLKYGYNNVKPQNMNLMNPASITCDTPNLRGEYAYKDGRMTVCGDAGFAVSFGLDLNFAIREYKNWMFKLDSTSDFNIRIFLTARSGLIKPSLVTDYYDQFGYKTEPKGIAAGKYERTLSLLATMTWNDNVPADGKTTVQKVTLTLTTPGTMTIDFLQAGIGTTGVVIKDGKTNSASYGDPTKLLSDIYTVDQKKAIISGIDCGTGSAAFAMGIHGAAYMKLFDGTTEVSGVPLKTKMVATLYKDGRAYLSYALALRGDVNGDGMENSADARRVVMAAVDPSVCDEVEVIAGDFNKSGTLSSDDARVILTDSVS